MDYALFLPRKHVCFNSNCKIILNNSDIDEYLMKCKENNKKCICNQYTETLYKCYDNENLYSNT